LIDLRKTSNNNIENKTLISMQTGHPFGNFYAAADELGLIFIP
jgi:hypothetical protein